MISGDGSLAIGAVWSAAKQFSNDKIIGLESIYLGTKMDEVELDLAISNVSEEYEVINKYTSKDVAKWINMGFIIARCEGDMEFGQRALGNRSILADREGQILLKQSIKRLSIEIFGCLLPQLFVMKIVANI